MRQSDKYFLSAQENLSPRSPSATIPFTVPQLCESLRVRLLVMRRASIKLRKFYHKTQQVSTMMFKTARISLYYLQETSDPITVFTLY